MQPHDIELVQLRIDGGKHSGNDCEVFGDIVCNGECRQGSPGDEQLFANGHDLNQLRRIAVEVDHIPSFLRSHCSSVHSHTDIGLRQSWCVIRAVACHRNESSFC